MGGYDHTSTERQRRYQKRLRIARKRYAAIDRALIHVTPTDFVKLCPNVDPDDLVIIFPEIDESELRGLLRKQD